MVQQEAGLHLIKQADILPPNLAKHFKHDDVIRWRHFPRYWPFVVGIHRSPVNFPHRGK